jgi:hypothetical protein
MKRHLLLVIVVLMLLPACGRKGELIVPGTVLPQAPSGLVAEPRGPGIILSFTRPDKNSAGRILTDLAGLKVLRAELPAGQDECPCSFVSVAYIDMEYPAGVEITGNRLAWLDPAAGIAPGKRYVYKVVGVNKDGYAGEESSSVTVRFLAVPEAPAGLTAEAHNGRVLLEWGAVSKDVAGEQFSDLTGYNIYRTLDPNAFPVSAVNPKPVQGTTYEDAGLGNRVTYYYRVTALRGTEAPYTEGEPSRAASAMPTDIEPPKAPVGMRAVPGEGFLALVWDPNLEDDLAGYNVYRKGPGDREFKRMNEKPDGRITYKDTDVSSGHEYTYTVTAVDNSVPPNESKRSDEVTVKMP